MSSVIRIKRRASGSPGAPSSLQNAELAYNEVDNTLYYGKGTGGAGGSATTVEAIAGAGAFVDRSSAQSIDGAKIFTSSPLVPTPTQGDSSTKAASTAFVQTAIGAVGGSQAANTVYAGPASGGNAAPSYRLLVPADIPTLTSAKISDFNAQADSRIAAQKGAVNGIVPLGADSKIAALYLPSYVDDVLEAANLTAIQALTGETGKIYVAIDTGKAYRFSGSVYIEIFASPGSTDGVAEGTTNLYFTMARVLSTVLSGLSTATSAVITSADTVLSALGKLQAQVTARLVSANNLSDLASASAARTNLGLGTMATQNASAVIITGGSIDNVVHDGGIF